MKIFYIKVMLKKLMIMDGLIKDQFTLLIKD